MNTSNPTTYIPQEILFGIRNLLPEGDDTTAPQRLLAFPTYKEKSGKLRRQTSLVQFKDRDSELLVKDNNPVRGFSLVAIQADSYSYRSYENRFRVQDPRGFEIEITVENMFRILSTHGLSGIDFNDEYVYGFSSGGQVQLVPMNTEWHKESIAFTELQDADFNSEELIPGYVYEFKDKTKQLYLGKFETWGSKNRRGQAGGDDSSVTTKIQRHIFSQQRDTPDPETGSMYRNSNYFRRMQKLTEVGKPLEMESIELYRKMLKELDELAFMHKVVEVITAPVELKWESAQLLHTTPALYLAKDDYYLEISTYCTNWGGYYNPVNQKTDKETVPTYRLSLTGRWETRKKDDHIQIERVYTGHHDYVAIPGQNLYTQQELQTLGFVSLNVKLSDNSIIPVREYTQALN